MIDKILNLTFHPQTLIQKIWRRIPLGSYKLRLDYDIFPRPEYAYCISQATKLSKLLGLKKISLLEFGVAGGSGLLAIEKITEELERESGMRFEIYGFDTGEGLPEPNDYRDLPYIWKEGFYKMDVDSLQKTLKVSKLVLGDVQNTIRTFFDDYTPAPIGAVLIDLDFFSSTANAIKIFEADHEKLLPRIFCYFDDTISSEVGIQCEYVGQLLAINEFNKNHESRKLAKIAGLRDTRNVPARWNDQIYVLHDFKNNLYNKYIHPDADRQQPLSL